MKYFYSTLLLFFVSLITFAQQRQSLAGSWQFKLDENNKGIGEEWYRKDKLPDVIHLPGTTDEAQYGKKTSGSDFGILTRAYKYYGPAWYQKEIEVPEEWKNKRIFLLLERVLWESKVYVDGKEISKGDALSSPHLHDLGYLPIGKHRLTIRINNDLIYNIGDKGHVYTEYTQSIWNGVVGKVELIAKEKIRLSNPQIYTSIAPKTSIEIKDTLVNESGKNQNIEISYCLKDRKTDLIVFQRAEKIHLHKGNNALNFEADMPVDIKLWDDVNPNLYDLQISIIGNKKETYDTFNQEIGFREITTSRNKILVNNKPVFLRGNLDCVHFPLTGYPSCDVDDWMRIFSIYKDYGLNHVRFHSWCPPKAAFVAADRLGLYLQAETIWIDWWMEIKTEGREEMWTKGLPSGLGKNPSADDYVQKELKRMIDTYGNHASFAMQCIGNELGNSDFKIMESWVKPLQENDSRRLYSLSAARQIMAVDQYMVTHYLPEIGAARGISGGASTDWDFENVYSQTSIPTIAHEIGQWPVYPKWDEIKKYKGVLKARNLEEFRQQAQKNKIENQNEDFVSASGALNQIMYKYEIESFLRTPSCAGIQLLSMQDYQGQGEALIGWLDVFYDSKGITTPEKVRLHQDTTVALLRIPKYVWKNDENFVAKMQLAHYGTHNLEDALYWKIRDELGNLIASGETQIKTLNAGTSDIVGNINYPLSEISKATKLEIEVGLIKEPVKNYWNIWVYPSTVEKKENTSIYTTNRLDAECIKQLEKGAKVLLDASELGTEESSDKISFYPLYWSLTFFPGQGKNTIGMVVQDKHSVFESFPTDSHSDWQWEYIYKDARAFYINDFPERFKPMAQPVDDFHRNNKLGSIFELKVGKGKLLVTGFNIMNENNPVAMQLKSSMLNYMQSSEFDPYYEPDINRLKSMLAHVEPLIGVVTKEFNNPMLYINCGAKSTESGTREWAKELDDVSFLKKADYKAQIDKIYKSDNETAWQGKEIAFSIDCPPGIIGSIHVCFLDDEKRERTGDITFEGRSFKLSKMENDKTWVEMHIMREDSNDGILKFVVKSLGDSPMLISEIAITED